MLSEKIYEVIMLNEKGQKTDQTTKQFIQEKAKEALVNIIMTNEHMTFPVKELFRSIKKQTNITCNKEILTEMMETITREMVDKLLPEIPSQKINIDKIIADQEILLAAKEDPQVHIVLDEAVGVPSATMEQIENIVNTSPNNITLTSPFATQDILTNIADEKELDKCDTLPLKE